MTLYGFVSFDIKPFYVNLKSLLPVVFLICCNTVLYCDVPGHPLTLQSLLIIVSGQIYEYSCMCVHITQQ